MRHIVVKRLRKEFNELYNATATDAVNNGQVEFDKNKETVFEAFARVLPRSTAWRIYKRAYLSIPHHG